MDPSEESVLGMDNDEEREETESLVMNSDHDVPLTTAANSNGIPIPGKDLKWKGATVPAPPKTVSYTITPQSTRLLILISSAHLLTQADLRMLLALLEYDDVSMIFDDAEITGIYSIYSHRSFCDTVQILVLVLL